MEEGQNQEPEVQETPQEVSSPPSGVSFPTVGEQKKSGGAKTLLIIGVLILVGILGFVIYKSASTKSEEVVSEPTPFDNLIAPSPNTVATPLATSTPAAVTVDKTKIKIQVQNGTGITGEASYLQTQLKGLGYTNVSVGNSTQNLTATQVSFASTLSSDVVTELTNKLNSIYQGVTPTTAASSTYDVVVVTGLRKGATPKPTASATTSPTPTATP